jgi:hypothetical protein
VCVCVSICLLRVCDEVKKTFIGFVESHLFLPVSFSGETTSPIGRKEPCSC